MTSSPKTSPHSSKPLFRGEDGECLLVATSHELEEEHGAGVGDREIADLIDVQQRRVREHLEALMQTAGGLSLLQLGDQVGLRAVVDASTALGGGNDETDGQVHLTDAGRPEENHVLAPLYEAELMKTLDLLPPQRGLKGEVEFAVRSSAMLTGCFGGS